MLPALLVLLLGAPEADATKLLKVAYASQYEWKEDGLKNVTLEFTYTWSWGPKETPKDKKPPPRIRHEGAGRVVVVGQRVIPGHYPDLGRGQTLDGKEIRAAFQGHIAWILRRFVRQRVFPVSRSRPTMELSPSCSLGTIRRSSNTIGEAPTACSAVKVPKSRRHRSAPVAWSNFTTVMCSGLAQRK